LRTVSVLTIGDVDEAGVVETLGAGFVLSARTATAARAATAVIPKNPLFIVSLLGGCFQLQVLSPPRTQAIVKQGPSAGQALVKLR
jgi:hypothetical protein